MNVSYIAPLQRAWARARRMLFTPFVLRTWLVLGFAAFLSELTLTGRGMQSSWQSDGGREVEHILHGDGGLLAGGLLAGLGMLLLAALVIVVIAMLWINSRGRFVFLDGIVRERAAIVEPWGRYGKAGDALFVWMLLFIILCIAAGGVMVLPFIATIAATVSDGGFHWGVLGALWVLFAVAVPFTLFISYVMLFLSDFVVPIMYRDGLGVMEAWRRFMALFRAHPGSFLLYGLFVLAVWIAILALAMVVGVSTCCVGFILLGIPYVSHVVLLPVLVTLRGLGPEFLAQFGEEYSVFAAVPPGGAEAPDATAAPPRSGGTPPPPGGGA